MAGDPAILRPVGEPAFTPDTGALGSSGKVQVTYEAMARGQTALQLGYRRPFEPNVPPRATFEVTVVVQ
jgi:predicted secreted protein